MVEVYRTNVNTNREEAFMLEILCEQFPYCKINFDLEDCDHILRIEKLIPQALNNEDVIFLVQQCGFEIEVLPELVPHHINKPVGMLQASKNP
jgi:hypothetical protein